MPSSYTLNLGIEKPADGEQDSVWGDIVNENMDILDRAINGQVTLTLSGTSSTLTTSTSGTLTNGQYKLLVLAGTPSGTHTITIAPNDAQKIYFVQNNTAQSVVFTQGSGGNVTLAASDSAIIYADGALTTARVQNITDNFAFGSVKITGGTIAGVTIDGSAIGGTTPAAVSGTTGIFSSVGIGAAPNAATLLDMTSTTKGFRAPSMTTTQRDAIASPVGGLLIYNTSQLSYQAYNGTSWTSVGGGATGGGADQVFVENGQIVTASYTIPATKNAMSTGPITINAGATVTVSSGARYVVI